MSQNSFKYMSLGRHCDVSSNLRALKKELIANFFDWLRADFEAAVEIISRSSMYDLLHTPDIVVGDYDGNGIEYAITLRYFEQRGLTFLSHHDVKIKNGSHEEKEGAVKFYIDRYSRRHERLINGIRTCENPLLFVVRGENIEEHVAKFFDAVKRINGTLRFFLIHLVSSGPDATFQNNVLTFNYSNHKRQEYSGDAWQLPQIDWKKTYEEIEHFLAASLPRTE
jgi:hypothetical protein